MGGHKTKGVGSKNGDLHREAENWVIAAATHLPGRRTLGRTKLWGQRWEGEMRQSTARLEHGQGHAEQGAARAGGAAEEHGGGGDAVANNEGGARAGACDGGAEQRTGRRQQCDGRLALKWIGSCDGVMHSWVTCRIGS